MLAKKNNGGSGNRWRDRVVQGKGRSFRTNDIMWAWLDGRSGLCGRLISPEQKAQGDALIEEMQDRIIQEFLGGAAGGAGAGDF